MTRPALKLKSLDPRESDVQRAVLQTLKMRRDVAWVHRFNVGAHAGEYVDSRGRRKRKFVRYAFPGCSDILGQMEDGRFLAVEVKTRTGRLTRAQRDFLELVKSSNGVAFVARSSQDVIDSLNMA